MCVCVYGGKCVGMIPQLVVRSLINCTYKSAFQLVLVVYLIVQLGSACSNLCKYIHDLKHPLVSLYSINLLQQC